MLKIICTLIMLFLLPGIPAGASPAPATSEIDNYLQGIANKCLKCYFPPPSWETGIASESFILNNDGSVSQIKIIVHSRRYGTKQISIAADKALELAVQNAVPFPKPPKCLHTPVKVVLTMDRSVVEKPLKAKLVLSTINNSELTADTENSQYLQKIADKCRKAYFQVPLWETGLVSESFILNSDGSVSQIQIIVHPRKYKTKQTSAASDMALILAVKNSAPFEIPPPMLHAPIKLVLTVEGPGIGRPIKTYVVPAP